MDEELEPIPWNAPGLLRRIQERRRYRPQPKVRKTLRQRFAERGLHWSTEVVVGMFMAVAIASFAAVLVATGGSHGLPGDTRTTGGSGGTSVTVPGGSAAGGGNGGGSSDVSGGGTTEPFAPPTDAPALCFLGSQPRPCNR